jgi:hypothetical protein
MRIVGNVLLLIASLAVSVLAAEALSRFVVDPVDYLLPRLTSDDFLLHRVEGYSGGHDAWGFRNYQKPETADIVCIGDSMTYGISAQARDSWPAALGRISGTSVYNMGLGGYGPIQYLHLMRTKATTLHPKTIIVGLYLGNDLMDVYHEVRFNKNWSEYGSLQGSELKGSAWAFQPPPGKFLGDLRYWLSHHSIFYALLTRAPVFDSIRNALRKREMMKFDEEHDVVAYRDETHNVIFNLSQADRFIDMGDQRIMSAMEITKRVMLDMRDLANKEGFRLIIAVIPTKERVYAKLLRQVGFIEKHPRLLEVVNQEEAATDIMVSFLRQANIEMVDLLPSLEAALKSGDPYPLADAHPNKEGYLTIAETIHHYLETHR